MVRFFRPTLYLTHTRTELTQKNYHSDQTKQTVHAPHGPPESCAFHEIRKLWQKVVKRHGGQHVNDKHSAQVFLRDNRASGVRDSPVVDVDDKEGEEDVGNHHDVAHRGETPQ